MPPETMRGQMQAPIRDSHEFGFDARTIMLMDLSQKPRTNDRGKKLGAHATFFSAVVTADLRRHLAAGGDGTSSPLVRFLAEPDNWVFRKGKGFDSVWALRISVDHTNKSQSATNRSTHFIDQNNEQRYGQADDLFWIVKREVKTENKINPAGIEGSIAGGGKTTRDALALAMARNTDFTTDGKIVGQLSQAFTFYKKAAGANPPPTPSQGGGGSGGGGGGPTPSQGGSGPPSDPAPLPTGKPGAGGGGGDSVPQEQNLVVVVDDPNNPGGTITIVLPGSNP